MCAFEKPGTCRSESPVAHWLVRIALLRCADFWRGKARQRETVFSTLGLDALNWVQSVQAEASPGGLEALAEGNEAIAARPASGPDAPWAAPGPAVAMEPARTPMTSACVFDRAGALSYLLGRGRRCRPPPIPRKRTHAHDHR
ncbi:MAG: hypothetical protein KKA55_09300 [Proteobacteria bacterium]|nr:hypothetical protein [Pseudomonadota bacterium]MBU1595712.1 hypothetical protein [Pseudomonadota bacterium]